LTSTLLRLLMMSLRGRLLRWARQLKRPKYLVGFVLGTLWILFWAFNWMSQGIVQAKFVGSQAFEQLGGVASEPLQLLAAVGFALVVSLGWLLPFGRLALPLKESELHLLLPAPLTRRQLIQYALLKAQVPIVITTVVFTILWGSGSRRGLMFVALWLLFNLLDHYSKWLTMTQLRLRQVSSLVSRAVWVSIWAALALFWGALAPRLYAYGLAIYEAIGLEEIDFGGTLDRGDAAGVEQILARVADVPTDPVLALLLAPFRWVIAPLFNTGVGEFTLGLVPGALALILLHEGIVRSRARFEDAAFEHARKEATKKSPTRRYRKLSESSRKRSPFSLPPVGRPEMAIIWKNIMQCTRIPLTWLVAGGFGLLTAVALIPALFQAHDAVFIFIAMMGVIFLPMIPWISVFALRNDIRMELPQIDLTRTLPLPGFRYVMAAIVSPAIVGTLIGALAVGLTVSAYAGIRIRGLMFGERLYGEMPFTNLSRILEQPLGLTIGLLIAGVLPIVAGSAVLCSGMNNLVTLMFPAWIGLGPTTVKGMAALGHRMLLAMVLALAMLVALIPGAAMVTLAILIQVMLDMGWSGWLLPVWGLLVAVPMFVEAWLIAIVAGRLWDALDPSGELLEAGS